MASEQTYIERRRLELHSKLVEILGNKGKVYFQPPESIKIEYPAIIYERNAMPRIHASNNVYAFGVEYSVTVIDKDPDSPIVDKISRFPTARFSRHFVSDNLNHDIFMIHY